MDKGTEELNREISNIHHKLLNSHIGERRSTRAANVLFEITRNGKLSLLDLTIKIQENSSVSEFAHKPHLIPAAVLDCINLLEGRGYIEKTNDGLYQRAGY